MKIEVTIRLEGDHDPDLGGKPELIYISRAESLAFAPGEEEPVEAVAALSRQIEEVIDGAVLGARNRVALIADHLSEGS